GPCLQGDTAHAVADQQCGMAGAQGGVQDGGEIIGEGAVAEWSAAQGALAVAALIVGDHPVAVGEGVDLRVPVLDTAAPAVDEHDRLGIGGTVGVHTQAGAVDGGDGGDLGRIGGCVEGGVPESASAQCCTV